MKIKGIYPYEYMNLFDKFNERKLPYQKCFYSKLRWSDITYEEYESVSKVLKLINCKTLLNYHKKYMRFYHMWETVLGIFVTKIMD